MQLQLVKKRKKAFEKLMFSNLLQQINAIWILKALCIFLSFVIALVSFSTVGFQNNIYLNYPIPYFSTCSSRVQFLQEGGKSCIYISLSSPSGDRAAAVMSILLMPDTE